MNTKNVAELKELCISAGLEVASNATKDDVLTQYTSSMNIDTLKAKCKELGLKGYSKLHKAELEEFVKTGVKAESVEKPKSESKPKEPAQTDDLTVKTCDDLKAYCKNMGIKGYSGKSKADLVKLAQLLPLDLSKFPTQEEKPDAKPDVKTDAKPDVKPEPKVEVKEVKTPDARTPEPLPPKIKPKHKAVKKN